MTPFEERYTAWTDGAMSAEEKNQFERDLESAESALSLQEAEAEREGAKQLGALLRKHSTPPPLSNADFLSSEIARLLEADKAAAKPARQGIFAGGMFKNPVWRLMWGGGACVGAAAVIFFTLVVPNFRPVEPAIDYYAQIINPQPGDPSISAVAFHDDADNITVLWLDGLDYVPKPPTKQP